MLTATSPTLRDTDGDSFDDALEQVNATNPLIAQVPAFDVRLSPTTPGVQIAIDRAEERGTLSETLRSETTARSATDQQTDTKVHTDENVFKENAEAGCNQKDGCGFKVAVNFEQKVSDTITHSTQTAVTRSSQTQVQQRYQETLVQKLSGTGRLSATFQVVNSGDVALQVSRLTVLANAICLPAGAATGGAGGCLSPRQMTTVATLAPVDSQGNPITAAITLAPGDDKSFQFAATTVSTPILQSVMANPGNLLFTPASYELFTPDGSKNYTGLIANALRNQAATMTVDYDDGRVERTVLATNVRRDWGAPTQPVGLAAGQAFDLLQRQDPRLTHAVNDAGQLERVRDRAALPLGDDGRIPGAWAVMGTGRGLDAGTPFTAATLNANDRLTLAYVADADGDGLFDRQERRLGTSDTTPDSDGDGARGPKPGRGAGSYSSDYFEALVGWRVPFPDAASAYQVYSSPLSCDADGDLSPDGPGAGAAATVCPRDGLGQELARTTDPTNADTNANKLVDGKDPRPLEAKPPPISSGSWRGDDLCPVGDVRYGGGCLLSVSANPTLTTPELTVCATGSRDPACDGVSGYYRASVDFSLEGCGTTYPSAPLIGSWAVVSGATRWLDADLTAGEPPGFAPKTYKLWFQVLGSGQRTRIAYTHKPDGGVGRCPGLLRSIKLDAVSQADYLRAGYNGTAADPGFAAFAIPAQSLARDAKDTLDGVQGVRIDPPAASASEFTTSVWGPGVDLPAGGYRAEFMLRAPDSGTDEHLATPAVSAGKSVPSQERIADGTGGLPLPTSERHSLVGGHVFHRDLPPTGAGQPISLLFDQRGASEAVSFPVAVAARTSGALYLDRVVVDRTPYVLAAAQSASYHGLGMSAWSRLGDGMVLNTGTAPAGLEPQSLHADWGSNYRFTLRSPKIPTAGRYVRWNVLFEPLNASYRECYYGALVNVREDLLPALTFTRLLAFLSASQFAESAAFTEDVRQLGDLMTPAQAPKTNSSQLVFGEVDYCLPTDVHQFTLLNRPAPPRLSADRAAPTARPQLVAAPRDRASGGNRTRRLRIALRVRDDGSSVAAMQLRGPSGTGDWRAPRTTIATGPTAIRLRDGAGNVSGWIALPRG